MVSTYKENDQEGKVQKKETTFNRMIKEGIFKVITLELGPEGHRKLAIQKEGNSHCKDSSVRPWHV